MILSSAVRSALHFEFRHDEPSWGCFADMYFKTFKVSSEENMLVTKKETRGVEENNTRSSLRKHPFLLSLRRRGRFVPSGEERGETDVFAGYTRSKEVLLSTRK